jgi:hypothetical protein
MYDDVYNTQMLELYKSTFVDANVKFEEYTPFSLFPYTEIETTLYDIHRCAIVPNRQFD